MQVFIRLPNGKTVTYTPKSNQSTLAEIRLWLNNVHDFYTNKKFVILLEYHSKKHPLTVEIGKELDDDTEISNLFRHKIIKEILFSFP